MSQQWQKMLQIDSRPSDDKDMLEKVSDEIHSEQCSVVYSPQGGGSKPEKPHGFILFACIGSLVLSLFLAALDIMIVVSLVEDVAKKFNGYSKTGWIFAGYSLPNALLALIWGRLACVIGLKTAMLLSIVIFEIGSLVSGVADSMNMLIGGRVIAGIGGSGLQSLCFVIGSQLVEESKRGIVIAYLGSAFGVASIAGPFLGGAFTTHATWRWCFYINLPIGGVAFFVFLMFYNPEGKGSLRNSLKATWTHLKLVKKLKTLHGWIAFANELAFRFDIIEFILCTAGTVLILLALTFGGNEYRWDSAAIIVMLVIGICLCIAALVYDFYLFPRLPTVKQNPQYSPLLVWPLIKKPGILTPTLGVFFVCAAYMCQLNYIVQFFQLIYNQSAWKASVRLIATMIPTILTVVISGVVNSKFGFVKPIAVLGGISAVVGGGLLTLLTNRSDSSDHIGLLILPGIAFGATIQSGLVSVQLQVDKTSPSAHADFVSVTTLNAFSKDLGFAFGGVICDTVFSVSVANKLHGNGNTWPIHSSNELISYRGEYFDGPRSKMGNLISNSIRNVFYMALGLSAIGFLFNLFTSNKMVDLSPHPKVDEESSISST
ncbi:related to Azole resistance protein 1 [Zygosaccharomyces bailii ISA1307]|nr:related to Azole resistance protein 1 [Zygosaccharomyces bailii ISA1307]